MYKYITHNSLAVLLLLATVLVYLLHPLALQGRGGEHGGGDDVVVHLRGVAGRKLLVLLLGLSSYRAILTAGFSHRRYSLVQHSIEEA